MKTKATYIFKNKPDTNDLKITSDSIRNTAEMIIKNEPYGAEARLIKETLSKYPKNTDRLLVAMKVSLIDVTNSTNLSRYKRFISLNDVVDIILGIEGFDSRVKDGDCSVVSEIARQSKEKYQINLFSFASKYCTYHNYEVYQKDDYSIYDGVLHGCLPLYVDGLKSATISKWKNSFDYKSYNN